MFKLEQLDLILAHFMNELALGSSDKWLSIDANFIQKIESYPLYSGYNHNERFLVLESDRRITLLNEDFLIWLVPYAKPIQAADIVIASLYQAEPKLELVLHIEKPHHTPDNLLKILSYFLREIKENELCIRAFRRQC